MEGGREMSEKTINAIGCVCFLVILVAAFTTLSLVASQRDELKQQAVERGCAEWVVKSDGSTTWQWKEAAK
jgi:hypothetical protein